MMMNILDCNSVVFEGFYTIAFQNLRDLDKRKRSREEDEVISERSPNNFLAGGGQLNRDILAIAKFGHVWYFSP